MKMIKLIIFDLDGVLISTKQTHFDTLNEALSEVDNKYVINWDDHSNRYDGLKTMRKLEMLTEERGLPESSYNSIWNRKQELTLSEIDKIDKSELLLSMFSKLSSDGYKIACCSNSIRKTVLSVLSNLGIIKYFDFICSNEDVVNGKPHPEMYWNAISNFGFIPEETLIVEDSPYGLLSASRSGSFVMRVTSPSDVTYESVSEKIKILGMNKFSKPKWSDNKLNILIPMAGAGSRFESAGYTFPKPLIEVFGKPMIQVVVDNINIDANYIYVVQKSHRVKYNLDTLLNLITPNCKIVETEGITEGAACTALLARDIIDNDSPLFFANSDQFVEWDSNEFMYKMNETSSDGGIVTFKAVHPKWSFAKIDKNGLVTEVAEKNPISDIATVGYYYWKRGSDFVKCADQMISKDIRVNNEFYVCPVFNEAILNGLKIRTFNADKMWGLGTPEDLKNYVDNYK
jgi:beta-phosphoglucomutase-like phosphatase (HAD superfamily)/dTDP-glucose pyrophosphorylase